MTAFDNLKKLTNKLGQLTNGLTNDEKTSLLKCLDNAHQYMRSHLAFNIKDDSNCASHCFKHACSDPKNSAFAEPCTKDHNEECFQCNNIVFILEALEMAIARLRDSGHSAMDCN